MDMFEALKLRLGRSFVSFGRVLQQTIRLPGTSSSAPRRVRARPSRGRDTERTAERVAAARMQSDLATLLDQHTSTRGLMRHLDLIDRVLRRSGIATWERLPTRVHVKALAELESLVTDWSAAGLAELRSRTAVLLKGRPAEAAAEHARIGSAEIDATQRADVSEVEHAVYEEMERSWIEAGSLTAAEAAAAARPMPLASADRR
jgi:hypothetical protein